MEKMTRMSKYKELRESLKNEVITTEETKNYVTNQEIVKDASYYRNLVGEDSTIEKQVEIKQPIKDDTLLEPLTFDTITENETEVVKTALDKVRENNGQEQYNTRMDILNKIRQSKVETATVVNIDDEEIDAIVEEAEELKEENKEFSENRFGYVKEEIKEEVVEEDEEEESKPKKRFGLFKRKDQDEEDDEDEEEELDDEDDEEEGSSFMVKLLNGCIIVLVLVLIGLVAFIAKEVLL